MPTDLTSIGSSIGINVTGQQVAQLGTGFLQTIVYFLLGLLVVGVFGFLGWIVARSLRFNKKILILKKVNGRVEKVGKDRAIEFRYDQLGDAVFLLQKRKKYLPIPTLQTARNEFTYFIREDGEWINVDYPDIDENMRKMKVHFTDTDLRLARTAMYKNLKDRYNKPKFMEKYGPIVVNAVFLAIVMIGMIFLVNQMTNTQNAINRGIDSTNQLVATANNILASLNNICSNAHVTPAAVG
jgi:hypothetical protein